MFRLSTGDESYEKGEEQEKEDEGAYSSGDVAVGHEESDVVTEREGGLDVGRLPPWSAVKDFS